LRNERIRTATGIVGNILQFIIVAFLVWQAAQ